MLPFGEKARLAGAAVLAPAIFAGLSVSAPPAQAAFPGDNGRIACQGPLGPIPPPAGGSSLEIFDINPNGSGERKLTDNTNSDGSPRYSADGRRIVFNRDNQIWTMNADGSNATRLTFALGSNTAGSWSPDGTQIAFQSTRDTGGSFEIYRMNADGSNQTRLTENPAEDSLPSWSPDGRKIVFNSRRAGSPDLFTINPDGSAPTQLTNFPGEEAAAQWSPDGRQLVFHSDLAVFPRPGVGRNLEIYRINSDGSGSPTRLTFNDGSAGMGTNDLTGFDLFPAWSPAGDRIVFHSGRAQEFRDTGFGAANFGQWEAYTIDAVNGDGLGGDLRRLTTRPGNDERCNWAPIPRAAPAPPVYPTPPFSYPRPPVTPPGAGKLRTSLTLKARPRRDRRPPFRFTFSGRVRVPSGTNAARVCGGRVRLVVKKGRRTVARGSARVSRRCTYKRRITIRSTRRTGRRKARLRVNARFGGNASLKASKRSTTVRIF